MNIGYAIATELQNKFYDNINNSQKDGRYCVGLSVLFILNQSYHKINIAERLSY